MEDFEAKNIPNGDEQEGTKPTVNTHEEDRLKVAEELGGVIRVIGKDFEHGQVEYQETGREPDKIQQQREGTLQDGTKISETGEVILEGQKDY